VAPREAWGQIPVSALAILAYHCLFMALLVAATFIDYDLMIIPDEVTVTGMVLGVGLGTLFPWIRPEPAAAAGHWAGLGVGVVGLLAGGGLTAFIRSSFSFLLRREAMGFGDVTLMAMIGAFLGWQAAVLSFFLFPFFGLAHAAWKLMKYLGKRMAGVQSSSADREIPAGPYISMAAAFLVYSWPWLWPLWAKNLFEMLHAIFWFMLGVNVGPLR
jgi:leader peptidase (prepilin peptidase)/N-methyltransferase